MNAPIRIYLASRYSRREELKGYGEILEGLGYVVTSRWLSGRHELRDRDKRTQHTVPMEAQPFAIEDYQDVNGADILLAFTETPGYTHRGGRHVKLGLALAWQKRILIVGPRENVFYTMPQIEQFPDWESALEELRKGVTV